MAGDLGQIQDGSREVLVHVQARERLSAGQVLDTEEKSWTKTVPSWMSAALMDGVPDEGFWWWLFIAIKRNGCGTKSKFDVVGGFRRSLIDGIMRTTDAMIHRSVRRCQRDEGGVSLSQSLLGALEAKFTEDVLRSSEDHDLKRENVVLPLFQGAWAQELEDAKGQI